MSVSFIENYQYFSPGGLSAGILQQFGSIPGDTLVGYEFAFAVVDYLGRVTIQVSRTFPEGDTLVVNHILWTCLTGTPYPVRYFTDSPGWMMGTAQQAGQIDSYGADGLIALWVDYITQTLIALIEAATGESATSTISRSLALADDFQIVTSVSYIIGSVLDSTAVAMNVIFFSPHATGEDVPFTEWITITGVTPAGPGVVIGGGSVDLAPLVDAVNGISDQDIEISINHGAQVYSIKGKILTGV